MAASVLLRVGDVSAPSVAQWVIPNTVHFTARVEDDETGAPITDATGVSFYVEFSDGRPATSVAGVQTETPGEWIASIYVATGPTLRVQAACQYPSAQSDLMQVVLRSAILPPRGPTTALVNPSGELYVTDETRYYTAQTVTELAEVDTATPDMLFTASKVGSDGRRRLVSLPLAPMTELAYDAIRPLVVETATEQGTAAGTAAGQEAGSAAGLAAVAPEVQRAEDAADAAQQTAAQVTVAVNQGVAEVNQAADSSVASLAGIVADTRAAAADADASAEAAAAAASATGSFALGQIVPIPTLADAATKVPSPVVDTSKVEVWADPPAPAAANADGTNRNGIWIYRSSGWQFFSKSNRTLDRDVTLAAQATSLSGLVPTSTPSATTITDGSTGLHHEVLADGMAAAKKLTTDLKPDQPLEVVNTRDGTIETFAQRIQRGIMEMGDATEGNILEYFGAQYRMLRSSLPNAKKTTDESGRIIEQIDTQAATVLTEYLQQFKDATFGTIDQATLVDFEGIGTSFNLISGPFSFLDSRGMMMRLDPASGTIEFRISEAAPSVANSFFRTPAGGVLAQVPDPGYVTNRFPNIGLVMPAPTSPLMPRFIPAALAPERALAFRKFSGIPSIEAVTGTRHYAAWMANILTYAEGPGDFLVVAYTDDAWATSTDLGYVVFDDPTYRVINSQWWLAPDGVLHFLFSITKGENDIWYGTFGFTIKNPKGILPCVSTVSRLATFGIPTKPTLIDETVMMSLDVRPTSAGRLYPTYSGTTFCEYDWRNRQLLAKGKNPLNINTTPSTVSWPEGSLVQLNGGALQYTWRSSIGQMVMRSESGNPNGPWSPFGPWTALNSTPDGSGRYNADSRATVRTSPTGRMIASWNDNVDRVNLVVGVSVDGGQTIAQKVALGVSGRVAYPEISFDPATGDILIIFDRYVSVSGVGSVRGQIVLARVSEAALVAGTAVPAITTISTIPLTGA